MVPLNYKFILYKHGPFSSGKLANILEKKHINFIKKNKDFINFIIEKLANRSVKELERVATALYVKKKEKIMNNEKMVERIIELKPHITKPLAEEAVNELKSYYSQAKEKGLVNSL